MGNKRLTRTENDGNAVWERAMKDLTDADFDGETEGWPAIKMRSGFLVEGELAAKGRREKDAEGESLQK